MSQPTTSGPWGLRALALSLALLVWFFSAVEKREAMSDKVIEASVTYNTPSGFIILDPVQRVKLRLRGPTSRIRSLNPVLVDVLAAPQVSSPGTLEFTLGPENVVTPESIEVVSIEPNLLRLEVDQEITAMVPIVPSLAGEPAAGAIAGAARSAPDRALVSGPRSRVERIAYLPTTAVRLEGHFFEFTERAGVMSPDPLVQIVEPSVVAVTVPLTAPSPSDEPTPRDASGANPAATRRSPP